MANKILIQMTYLNAIGGIETAIETVVRTFKDRDFTIVINATQDGALHQIKRYEKYAKVVLDRDRNMVHEADVALIFTTIMMPVPWDTIKAPKIYQFIHSDIKTLIENYDWWRDFKWTPDKRITKCLAVSDTARDGLKEALGVDSEIVPNIFNPDDSRRVFLYMGRATSEKGLDRTLELMKKFDAAGKEWVLVICSLVDPYGPLWPSIDKNPRIIYLPPNVYNSVFYKCADYLVQLSTSESWCYSIREALHNGCAVIGSKIPEIEKVVKDGENGYLLDDDLGNLDIDKIFNKKPKVDGYKEEVNPIWQKVLDGQL